MNTIETEARDLPKDNATSTPRAQHIHVVAWLVGITAVVTLGTLSADDTLGAGFGVLGVCAMVTIVSYLIIKHG